MRSALAVILFLSLGLLAAQADVAIPVSDLIATPSKHIRTHVIIRRIRCVDPGGHLFVCAAMKGHRALRIEATSLGALTELPIAEKLIGPCKGAAKLESPACTFDVAITPHTSRQDDGAGGPGTVTVLSSDDIELYTPHKIR